MIFDTSNQLEKNKAISRFNNLIDKEKIIDVTEKKASRTVKQNSYIHVLFLLFAIELGYREHQAKTHAKRNCPFMQEEVKGERFLRRTRDLKTDEMTDFIEWFRNYSSIEHGCYLPTPDEYRLNRYMIDNEITRHKQYL